MAMSIPNQLTLGRLGLAVVFVLLLSGFDAQRLEQQRWLLHLAFWVFLVAALTDVLDGLLARLTHSITSFGRIVDPVVDKVIVCAAFVLFASPHFWTGQTNLTGVAPWMVVVILARELLVSAVRLESESGGQAFAASWVGKLKMFVQSATVCLILGELAWRLDHVTPVRKAAVWVTVILTALSAAVYLHRARALLLSHAALAAPPAASASDANPGSPA